MNELPRLASRFVSYTMNAVIRMPRPPMNENDPLVPKQVSIPFTMKRQLKRASLISGDSESEIMRRALKREMMRMGIPLEDESMVV